MQPVISYSPDGGTFGRRLLKVTHAAALLYPLAFVAAFYVPWLSAWAALGQPPKALWDDPYETCGPIYVLCGLPVPLMPLGAVAALASVYCFAGSANTRVAAVLWAALVAGLWFGAIGLVRWDPFDVTYWWMD